MTMRSLAPRFCVFFFVQVLEVPKATTTRSLASHHRAFFCSNVADPRDTTRRSSIPLGMFFFCSNVKGPQGNDNVMHFFVPMLQVPRTHVFFLFKCWTSPWPWEQRAKLLVVMLFSSIVVGQSSGCAKSSTPCRHVFFCSSVISPKDTTMRSSTPCHCALLF
jgi:hypothetical protein